MIEFKRPGQNENWWIEAAGGLTANVMRRYKYIVRIDGVVKNIRAKGFDEELQKARMWEKLRD